MPASFAFPDRETRAWIPFRVPRVETGSLSMFGAIARLRSGVSSSQAAAEATTRARRGADPGMVAIAVFGSRGPVEVAVVPLLDAQTREVRPAILVFLVAVACATPPRAMSRACSSRVPARRRGWRSARRWAPARRLVRQFLAEACPRRRAARRRRARRLAAARSAPLPANFPRLDDIALNVPVLLFACAVSLLTGLVPGVPSARHAAASTSRSRSTRTRWPWSASACVAGGPPAPHHGHPGGHRLCLLVNAVLLRSFFARPLTAADPVNVTGCRRRPDPHRPAPIGADHRVSPGCARFRGPRAIHHHAALVRGNARASP
jgi:hypothetical protein